MCRELFNQSLGKHVLNGKHIEPLNILQVWTGHISSAQYTFHIAHSFKRLHNSLKRHWRHFESKRAGEQEPRRFVAPLLEHKVNQGGLRKQSTMSWHKCACTNVWILNICICIHLFQVDRWMLQSFWKTAIEKSPTWGFPFPRRETLSRDCTNLKLSAAPRQGTTLTVRVRRPWRPWTSGPMSWTMNTSRRPGIQSGSIVVRHKAPLGQLRPNWDQTVPHTPPPMF